MGATQGQLSNSSTSHSAKLVEQQHYGEAGRASAPLSSSHPARLENRYNSSSLSVSQPSKLTSSSVPSSPTVVSASIKRHLPNAATFLRMAQERSQAELLKPSPLLPMAPPTTPNFEPASPTLIAPTSSPMPAAVKNKQLGSSKQVRHRLSLFACENCNSVCQPDVLSEDGKIYCSGECYFSAAFRGEQHKIRKMYDEVFWDEFDLDDSQEATQDEQHHANTVEDEDADEYVVSCKRRARQLKSAENVAQKGSAHRPSLVDTSKPIRIPLPHPDYVPY